ncbi:purine-binding chemotaxis protein CheW [Halolactibacillus halophilus]|uniref:Chemotaxis protein CheW n=1 Tax=Halolactibacillus halophilus TaxID=306540 RepID=A0A1I5LJR9_9BACI|nr:chemotaxis protein CheW [Halolactibacillus halophilus]GEM00792.1 chemotaxis protein CheW [Halolactibacillus halophilus]SFO97452.1 purine-binding chemotaxis protein CheW [Halolactibacillus halophilus]
MALEFLKSIVFELNDEEYALPVDLVGAIERVMPITRIPGVPPFVKGVLNLRGVVTPVIDLRERFSFERQEETEATRIIIIQHDEKDVGLIVDACYDVIDIPNDTIEPAPETIGTVKIDYINGVAKYDERLLILLNINEILSTDVLNEFYEMK